MNQLTHFMYESAHEHRQNYAAINAQLHMINERLRSSDSMTGSSSSVSSNIKMKKELLRCISKEILKKQGEIKYLIELYLTDCQIVIKISVIHL